MKHNFLLISLLLPLICFIFAPSLSAQTTSERLVIGNGGQFGNPLENAHVIFYDLEGDSIQSVDTIQTQSVQDLLIEGAYAYVAAQDSIVKYFIPTGERLAATAFGMPSTVKLAVYDSLLLVGNWYGAADGNLRLFHKETLAFEDAILGITKGATDFLIRGDSAYVVQNYPTAAFTDSAGYLAIVDLKNRMWVRDITFANNDEELGRILVYDNLLYGFNSSSETVTTYDFQNGASNTVDANVNLQLFPNGQQFFLRGDSLYLPYDNRLNIWWMNTNSHLTSQIDTAEIVAMVYDSVNNHIYLTQTDFFSYTQGTRWDGNTLQKTGTFPVGSSPQAIGIAYNNPPTAIDDYSFATANIPLMVDVTANDIDPENDPLTVKIVTQPGTGMASVVGNQILYLSPIAGIGDWMEYSATDPWGKTDTAYLYFGSFESIDPALFGEVKLFPNPAEDVMKLELEKMPTHPINLSILDLQGREVYQQKVFGTNSLQLPVSQLSSGSYLLRLSNQEGSGTIRFVVK